MNYIEDLKSRIDTLCIFRELLNDGVIKALRNYLDEFSVGAYAEFVSALYEANGGDLGAYIKSACENSANVYVRRVGSGKTTPEYMKEALERELETLQMTADLSPEKLCEPADNGVILPAYACGGVDIAEAYSIRLNDIGKYGYGIFAKYGMFYVDDLGTLVPVKHPDPTQLSDLIDYNRERKIIIENTKALLSGKPAANILLTGDAGTGKSSTVKAVGNAMFSQGLRIIEVRKDQLRTIPGLLNELAENPLKFVLFIDDLSFLKDDDNFNALKAVLEGSVAAKSPNVVIYATSNRRHIIKEKFSDREGDDIHRNDTVQELVSLSERFGIHITFSKPDKTTFLRIVHHIARESGIDTDESELDMLAERFALERGGRSARLARQFIDGLLSKD